MLAMNMLLLLHLLLPYAFFARAGWWWGGSERLRWNWRRELRVYSWVLGVGLVLVSTSLQTLPLLERSHTTNTFEKTTSASSGDVGGKDNEFLCQVEEGDSPCFQKYNRQHWHGDRGQSSQKGHICYREWKQWGRPAAAWEFCIHLHWGGWTDPLIRDHFASKLNLPLSLLLFAWQQLPL